ncbi:MAG TPA: hypothetical protein VGD48_01265, partial [Kutzneria sp.]
HESDMLLVPDPTTAFLDPFAEVPTLVMYGEASFEFMRDTAHALAAVVPSAELRSFAGQGHDVSPEVLAPVLADFVTGEVVGELVRASAGA